MTGLRPHTKLFSQDARDDLGRAVVRARESAGHSQRAFVRLAGVSKTSLHYLETGQPVGPQVYEAVARKLPNWTEDDPVRILKGGDPPPTVDEEIAHEPPDPEPVEPVDYWTDEDENFMQALTEMLKPRSLKPTQEIIREMHREWERQQSQTDSDGSDEVG